MLKQIIILIFASHLMSSCTTKGDLRRQEAINGLEARGEANQKLLAEATAKIQELQEELAKVNGVVEEKGHMADEEITGQQDKISQVMARQDATEGRIKALEESLKKQQAYILEVLTQVKKLGTPKKKRKGTAYSQAMADYKKGKYKQARAQLELLEKSGKIKGNKLARIVHNLGMIAYMQKRQEDCQAYFSRLVSDFSKSPYVPNGLIFMSKSLKKSGEKSRAKQALELLIKKYPKSRHVKKAKRLLKNK